MSALSEYQERTKKEVLQATSKLESSQTYLTNKKKRIELSQLYSKVKGLSNPFPSTSSLSGGILSTLNKDVSESCPACVKKAVMLKTIDEAKADLENYARILGGVIVETKEAEPPKSIHELRPNIDHE